MSRTPDEKGFYVDGALAFGYDPETFTAYSAEVDASKRGLETLENVHAITSKGDHELNPRYRQIEQEIGKEPIKANPEQTRAEQPIQAGPNIAEPKRNQTIEAREQNREEKPKGPEINPRDSSIFSRQQAASTAEKPKTERGPLSAEELRKQREQHGIGKNGPER